MYKKIYNVRVLTA